MLLNPENFAKGSQIPAGYYEVTESDGLVHKYPNGKNPQPMVRWSLAPIDPDTHAQTVDAAGRDKYELLLPAAYNVERIGVGDKKRPADEQEHGTTGTHLHSIPMGSKNTPSADSRLAIMINSLVKADTTGHWVEVLSAGEPGDPADLSIFNGLKFKLEYVDGKPYDDKKTGQTVTPKEPSCAQILTEKSSKGGGKKTTSTAKATTTAKETVAAEEEANEGAAAGAFDAEEVAMTAVAAALKTNPKGSVADVRKAATRKLRMTLDDEAELAAAEKLVATDKWLNKAIAANRD